MFESINLAAVVVASIVVVAIRSVWYSPLIFGLTWMRELGLHIDDPSFEKKNTIVLTIKSVVLYCAFYTVLASIIAMLLKQQVPMLTSIGLIFSALSLYILHHAMWENKSFLFALIAIGYLALVLFGGMGIILYWPW